jgi:D-glycero-alpha-D-manno-heptose-7-phosphate kinase
MSAMPHDPVVEASAPARVDLAGGTLDLWPLHVLHPGSFTVNLAIDLAAKCRVRAGEAGIVVTQRGVRLRADGPAELLADPRTALVGSLLEALEVRGSFEIELESAVPFGSGLGGSSAMTVALLAAFERWSGRDLSDVDRVDLVRDVETRILGKPAGVQDFYPALEGGLHRIRFEPGRTRVAHSAVDPEVWDRHLTLFDTGAAHSSGLNNWEVFRARLEGDDGVGRRLEGVRQAAARMDRAVERLDFGEMGAALGEEWEARRRLAPVVSSPAIERAIDAAVSAGAWSGKACGAGGGGCVVFLSPAERTAAVRQTLGALEAGRVLPVRAVTAGVEVTGGS